MLCDLARPTCSACLRYGKGRPNHRCIYGPNAAAPSEAKFNRPDRSLDIDETFEPLPRTRSAARALSASSTTRPVHPWLAAMEEDSGNEEATEGAFRFRQSRRDMH